MDSMVCRKVVKTLLDLGAANVNLRGPDGRTPLQGAAQMGDPEKIAMLLDHQADPHMQSATGATAMDIVQSGAAEVLSAGGYNSKVDHTRLRVCLELLERAAVTSAPSLCTKVESGSPASILTEHHGSSTLLPEESDNNNFLAGSINHHHLLNNNNDDFFPSFPTGHLSGKGNHTF
jgi:regulatory protein NPR1